MGVCVWVCVFECVCEGVFGCVYVWVCGCICVCMGGCSCVRKKKTDRKIDREIDIEKVKESERVIENCCHTWIVKGPFETLKKFKN